MEWCLDCREQRLHSKPCAYDGQTRNYPTATAPRAGSDYAFRCQFWCQFDFKFCASQCGVVLGRNSRKALSVLAFLVIVQKRARPCKG
jgi:hypothetical protein